MATWNCSGNMRLGALSGRKALPTIPAMLKKYTDGPTKPGSKRKSPNVPAEAGQVQLQLGR